MLLFWITQRRCVTLLIDIDPKDSVLVMSRATSKGKGNYPYMYLCGKWRWCKLFQGWLVWGTRAGLNGHRDHGLCCPMSWPWCPGQKYIEWLVLKLYSIVRCYIVPVAVLKTSLAIIQYKCNQLTWSTKLIVWLRSYFNSWNAERNSFYRYPTPLRLTSIYKEYLQFAEALRVWRGAILHLQHHSYTRSDSGKTCLEPFVLSVILVNIF